MKLEKPAVHKYVIGMVDSLTTLGMYLTNLEQRLERIEARLYLLEETTGLRGNKQKPE